MKVLGVIPARGGSKGVPRKNLAPVLGRPLLEYTADAALASNSLSAVMLSTDDEEIASVGKRLGLEVPFIRPAALAEDSTPTLDVLIHLAGWMKDHGRNYDAYCLLQPTSPLRDGGLIDQCIERFELMDADSLVTISEVPHCYNPMWVYWRRDDGQLELSTGGIEPIKRRQLLPPAYIRDGRIYLMKTSVIIEQRSLFGKKLIGFPVEPGINIDTEADLRSFEAWVAGQS